MSSQAHSQMAKNRIDAIQQEIECIVSDLKEIYDSGGEPRQKVLDMHTKIDKLMDEEANLRPLT